MAAWALTFLSVTVAWVFFRATTFDSAWSMVQGMAGLNGVALPNGIAVRLGPMWEPLHAMGITTYIGGGTTFVFTWLWIALLLLISLLMPNTQEVMARFKPAVTSPPTPSAPGVSAMIVERPRLTWSPSHGWASVMGIMAALGVLALTGVSEFLYFQF